MGRLDRSRFPLLSIYKIIIKRTIQCTGLAFHSALTNQGREYLVQISNALVAYCISLSFSYYRKFYSIYAGHVKILLQLGSRVSHPGARRLNSMSCQSCNILTPSSGQTKVDIPYLESPFYCIFRGVITKIWFPKMCHDNHHKEVRLTLGNFGITTVWRHAIKSWWPHEGKQFMQLSSCLKYFESISK